MQLTIGFSGPAGIGINTIGILLGNLLTQKGYYLIGDKQYASLLTGGNNLFVLYISDTHYYIGKRIDYFLYFDQYAVDKNQNIYQLEEKILIKNKNTKFLNIYTYGIVLKLLNISLAEGEQILQEYFQHKVKDVTIYFNDMKLGWENITQFVSDFSSGIKKNKKLYYGNELVVKGAVAAGLEYYSAYPMTPASTLIDVITKYKQVMFIQGEDEIAVAMSMLGAKFAGKRAMCGTSGGGFALMSESLSFAVQTEIGGVYILSSRAGPSTGTPTFSEQGDLNYALNASFGEVYPIVIAPSSGVEGYYLIGQALNYADIYQLPVIFLIDKQFSETYFSISEHELQIPEIRRGNILSNPPADYARYAFTESGISDYTLPGTENGEFIASSYEHDEYGCSVEDNEIKRKMTEKRFQKIKTFIKQEYTDKFYGYEIINPQASIYFICFGMTRFAIEGFITSTNNAKYGIIIIKLLQPLDLRLQEFLVMNKNNITKLIFVEQNYSGQLEEYLVAKLNLLLLFGQDKIKHLRKYDLYPFFLEDISNFIFNSNLK